MSHDELTQLVERLKAEVDSLKSTDHEARSRLQSLITDLGTRLTEAALQMARDQGCILAQLTTHRQRTDAHRFYEQQGFAFTHLGMKKRLRTD